MSIVHVLTKKVADSGLWVILKNATFSSFLDTGIVNFFVNLTEIESFQISGQMSLCFHESVSGDINIQVHGLWVNVDRPHPIRQLVRTEKMEIMNA